MNDREIWVGQISKLFEHRKTLASLWSTQTSGILDTKRLISDKLKSVSANDLRQKNIDGKVTPTINDLFRAGSLNCSISSIHLFIKLL